MVKVVKQQGESDDKLINRFKKEVLNSGLLQEARDRSHYITKAEKRKEKKARIKHLIELEKKRKY
ncbi:30S ribosomal protein S21 [Candidatus Woesebacteria bacterium]|nr:MAG: 30S ribosomal protein S21 [Candidatus Woesebacteria bacterium]